MVGFNKCLKLMVISLLIGPSAWAAAPVVEMVGGASTVSVKRAGQTVQLKKGDALQAGDEVTTSKSNAVDIRLDDKTLIRVGANSSYRLEEDSSVHKMFHRLMGGIVRVLVPKVENPQGVRFRMQTPEGTIGVRGTEFVVIESSGKTQLKGLEGDVMFGPENTDFSKEAEFVHVKKGFESAVAKGGKPSAPVAYDLSAYLKQLKESKSAFGALASREQGAIKTRSASTSMNPVAEAPVATKGASVSKGKTKAKVDEAVAAAPSVDPDMKLFQAAARGDMPGLAEAVKAGAKVNKPMASMAGATALHAAVAADKLAAVKFLLGKGADVNAKDKDGRTPLMTMITETGNLAVASALLEQKPNEALRDNEGFSALDLAKEYKVKAESKEDKARYEQIVDLLDIDD